MLDRLNDGRYYTKYLTGQIEADFLDVEGKPDIATSDLGPGVGFLGAGQMASALAKAWRDAGLISPQSLASDPVLTLAQLEAHINTADKLDLKPSEKSTTARNLAWLFNTTRLELGSGWSAWPNSRP